MRRILKWMAVAALTSVIGLSVSMAVLAGRGFGFGGGMVVAFFPDLSGVNAFLSENGLDPFGDILIGGGGNGRGGMIGGPAAGGIGWGVVAGSEAEDRYAELVFGGGGFDLGAAIGGDESSVLTVGVVLGGGAMVLTLAVEETEPFGLSPAGIVIQPTERTIGRAMGFIQPYVSLEAQLLSWLGLELRIGYVLPVVGVAFGDLGGIPAPSLDLSGPMVSLGIVFGGIVSVAPAEATVDESTTEIGGSVVLSENADLRIENTMGDVVITSYPVDVTQTGSQRVVTWTALRTGRPRQLAGLHVEVEDTATGVALRTTGRGRVDYEIRVPTGTSLAVKNGMGRVALSSHGADSIVVENGIGDIEFHRVAAGALAVVGGVGSARLVDVEAAALTAQFGIGRIALDLPVDAVATVTARTGLGDVIYGVFPAMSGSVKGRFGKSGELVLSGGGPVFDLNVGIGEIDIQPLQP